ncbi:hypothetical protein AB0D38_02135 [Streptomyces sp. NPDC048279]|jgi:hypothetical protein|uniref:hypothetical protein n=1 Tax=Streptomyces sp. NPDC048279 TaxID=3154714 RepID=UPI0034496459
MVHHHKANRQVEGDPDIDHGRGMPRRPDETELERRTEEDRRDVGLPVDAPESAGAQYEEAAAEVDRQAGTGELRSSPAPRKDRKPFPPTHYDR